MGVEKPTGVFKREPRPRERTADDFAKACKYVRSALLDEVRSEGVGEHSAEVSDKTLEEVADGFLEGPLICIVATGTIGPFGGLSSCSRLVADVSYAR